MVPFFRQYRIDEDNPEIEVKPVNPDITHLMTHFDPDEDAIDRRILYEIC